MLLLCRIKPAAQASPVPNHNKLPGSGISETSEGQIEKRSIWLMALTHRGAVTAFFAGHRMVEYSPFFGGQGLIPLRTCETNHCRMACQTKLHISQTASSPTTGRPMASNWSIPGAHQLAMSSSIAIVISAYSTQVIPIGNPIAQ